METRRLPFDSHLVLFSIIPSFKINFCTVKSNHLVYCRSSRCVQNKRRHPVRISYGYMFVYCYPNSNQSNICLQLRSHLDTPLVYSLFRSDFHKSPIAGCNIFHLAPNFPAMYGCTVHVSFYNIPHYNHHYHTSLSISTSHEVKLSMVRTNTNRPKHSLIFVFIIHLILVYCFFLYCKNRWGK